MYNSYSYNGTGYNGVFNAGSTYHFSTPRTSKEDVFSDELKEHIKIDEETKNETEENEQDKKEGISPEDKQV